mgnify:CR=1 FL=1
MSNMLKQPFPKCFLYGNDGNGNEKQAKEYQNWATLAGFLYEKFYSSNFWRLKRAERLELLEAIERTAKHPPVLKPCYNAPILERRCYEAKNEVERFFNQ